MKKLKYFMITLLVGMVALTGCSKKNSLSPSEAIKKAVSNMQTSKNYKMNMEMAMAFSMGESLSLDIKLNGDILNDVTNGLSYTSMKVNLLGQDVTTETYTDIKSKEGKIITYIKSSEDDEWSKTETDYNENTDKVMGFFSKLEQNNNIKELSSDNNNYNYEIKITKDDLKSLSNIVAENDSLAIFDNIDGDLIIKVSIDKKTGNYSKLYFDMKDLIKNSMGNVEGFTISKAEFTITISDYNNAKEVVIPEEALAAEIIEIDDEIEYLFNSDDYDKILSCEISNNDISSELTIGFNDDKYKKSMEEKTYTFADSDEAASFWEEKTNEEGNNQSVFLWENEVSITTYHDATSDEVNYTYNDVKSMMEKDGYVCE